MASVKQCWEEKTSTKLAASMRTSKVNKKEKEIEVRPSTQ